MSPSARTGSNTTPNLNQAVKEFSHAHGVPLTYKTSQKTHSIPLQAELRDGAAVVVVNGDKGADNRGVAEALAAALPRELGAQAGSETVTFRGKAKEQQTVTIPLPAGGAAALQETLAERTQIKTAENASQLAAGVASLVKGVDGQQVQPKEKESVRSLGSVALPSGPVQVSTAKSAMSDASFTLTITAGEANAPAVKKLATTLAQDGGERPHMAAQGLGSKDFSLSLPASTPQDVATLLNRLDKAAGKPPISATARQSNLASLVPEGLKTGGVRLTPQTGRSNLPATPAQSQGTGPQKPTGQGR